MATHVSAAKRHHQSLEHQEHNRFWKSRVRTASKKVVEAVAKKDKKGAQDLLKAAVTEIYKARKEGVLHQNNAARKVARLSKQVASV